MTNRRFIITLDLEIPVDTEYDEEGYMHPRDWDWTTTLFADAIDGERVNKATVTEIPLGGQVFPPFPE